MNDFKNELSALLKIAAEAIKEDEKDYFVSYVVDRIENAYEATHDPGLSIFRNAVLAEQDKMIISKSELSGIWSEVQNTVSNFDAVNEQIGDLIGGSVLSELAHNKTENLGQIPNSEADGKFAALFDKVPSNFGKIANAISVEIASEGLESNVEYLTNNDNFAVFTAEIEDNGRIARLLVPVEISNGPCLPSVFYGNGFAEFNGHNLRRSAALGVQADINGSALLGALNDAAGIVSVDSREEWTATPAVQTSVIDLGSTETSVIGDEFYAKELSAEAARAGGEDFERLFREATVKCGRENLAIARQMLANYLKFARVSHDNIVVESEFDGGIRLGTNIKTADSKQFVIFPVEISDNGPLIPEIMQVGNRIEEFSEANLQQVAVSGEAGIAAIASNLNNLGFPQLHKLVVKAAQNSDIVAAEEIMAVILENHGEDLHRRAFQDMVDIMSKSTEIENQSEFDRYADELAAGGSDIARYVANKSTAAEFGLLD